MQAGKLLLPAWEKGGNIELSFWFVAGSGYKGEYRGSAPKIVE